MNTKNAPATPKAKTSNTSAPVQTFRLGRIKAAVWENEADNKRFYKVTFSRSYLGSDTKFHDTDSFGRDDLPLIAKLANEAHTYIFSRLSERRPATQAPKCHGRLARSQPPLFQPLGVDCPNPKSSAQDSGVVVRWRRGAKGNAPPQSLYHAASTNRLSQRAHAPPGENYIRAIVPLGKAITPNDPRFELMIGTHPHDCEHAKIPGALRAHERFSLSGRDRFDFDQVVAESAVVALGVPPTQLHAVPQRRIQLTDPSPKSRALSSF